MELTLTTPALLFSTVSLLMIAYTSRFLAMAALIRQLHEKAMLQGETTEGVLRQIVNLKKRVRLTKNMQFVAILALILSVLSILALFLNQIFLGEAFFFISLVLLVCSLVMSALEIKLSVSALTIQLTHCIGESCSIDDFKKLDEKTFYEMLKGKI
ncbi:DUF2721 domain-containing protein [uncultured Ilyobacter sp.]|jgi:hypothetical protein|uniref:DUF2721 domain-containing protein n=1 Tax=uncultured Ilyobacter sp. TaxID=544433 RepID=UPI0029C00AD4|nr:DUF2721 domain-containing protein [uncultured Ilyobacter sp.]